MQFKYILFILISSCLITVASCSNSTESELNTTVDTSNYSNILSLNSDQYSNQAVIVANISTESNTNTSINTLKSLNKKYDNVTYKLPYYFTVPINEDVNAYSYSAKKIKDTKKIKSENNTEEFYVFDFQNNSNYIITGNLVHSGTYCLIYAEENHSINDEDWQNIAEFFDTTIYPNIDNILQNTATDVDSNNKIILLYYSFNFESEDNSLLGYFWPYDLFSNDSMNVNYSNEAELLYLNINEEITTSKNKETIAHELTHLISLSKRVQDSGSLSQYDIWIEEGIATGASGFLINEKLTDFINYFDFNTSDNEIRNGLGLFIDDITLYSAWNYGMSFAFMEYCRLQYEQDGSFYGQLINNYNYNDFNDLFSVLRSIDESKFDNFEDILPYFHAANIINEPSGLLGYKSYYSITALEPTNTELSIGSGGAIYYLDSINNLENFTQYDDYDDNLLFILINH